MKTVLRSLFLLAILLAGCGPRNGYESGYQAGQSEIQTMEAQRGGSVSSSSVQTEVQKAAGAQLQLNNGVSVDISSDALYQDDVISLHIIDVAPNTDPGPLQRLGDAVEFEAGSTDLFKSPVTLTMPYDPGMVPSGFSEADLIAMYLHEGRWVRAEGEVDPVRNVIVIQTLHNSIWSWGLDTLGKLTSDMRSYLGIVQQSPATLEEARRLEEQRYAEFLRAWNRCDVVVKELEELYSPETIINEIAGDIALHAVDAAAIGLGGKSAVLMIGGHTVAYWGGAILSGIYFGRIMGNSALGVRCIGLYADAYEQLKQARAIVAALEHPDRTSFNAEDLAYIDKWIADQQTVAAVPTYTPTPPAPTSTATRPAPTSTPKPSYPTLYADQNYQCREEPGKTYAHVADILAGSTHRILARSSNGWYKIAIDFSHTTQEACWIGGGETTGDLSTVAYVEAPTQPAPVTNFSSVTVNKRKITISLIDAKDVDGDRIHLSVNGATVLSDLTLSGSYYTVEVKLNSGVNTIVITALNTGSSGPNTVQVAISNVAEGPSVQVSDDLETGQYVSLRITAP